MYDFELDDDTSKNYLSFCYDGCTFINQFETGALLRATFYDGRLSVFMFAYNVFWMCSIKKLCKWKYIRI